MPICPLLSVGQATPRSCVGPNCMTFIQAGEHYEIGMLQGQPGGWCGFSAPDAIRAAFHGPYTFGAPAPLPEPAPLLPVGGVEVLAESLRAQALAAAIAQPAPSIAVSLVLADNPASFPPAALDDVGFPGVLASLIGVPFGLRSCVGAPAALEGRVTWIVCEESAVEPLMQAIRRAVPARPGMCVCLRAERPGCAVELVDVYDESAATAPSAAPEA